MGDENQPEPLEGSLDATPLPLLLAQIFGRRISGLLSIKACNLATWIYFMEGSPSGVHIPNSEIYLGMILREMKFISDDDFNQSLVRMAETNNLQGQVLLDMGKVTREQLAMGLKEQLLRKLSQLCGQQSGSYKLEPGASPPNRFIAHAVHAFTVVYNGIRNNYSEEDLDRHLAPFAGKACALTPEFHSVRSLFESPDDDLGDIERLSEHPSIEEFARRARAGATAAKMLALTLHWCNLLQFRDPESRPEAAPPPKPEPAAQVECLPAAIRDRIAGKFRQAVRADFLGLLEVSADADPERIRSAYITLSKAFHPDRVARYMDSEVTKQVSLITGRLLEAYQALSDPQSRSNYLNNLIGAEERPITLNPEAAEVAYQKSRVYLNKKMNLEAQDSLRLAVRLNPAQITYRATLIWVELLCDPSQSLDRKNKAKFELLLLYKHSASNFFVNRYLSLVAQKIGDTELYEKHLQKANRIKPEDVETTREIRLLEMRKDKKKGKFE